jgi:thioesterase domain-containing protein
VILREDKPGDKQMIAYVVGDRFTPDALRTRLKERLPEYMIPSAFVTLRELPLTPNGKIDKSALPGPAREATQPDKKIPPSNKLELHLVKLWESLLESEPIGVTDDFFALGGHSLLAARMFDEIQTLFGKKLPLDTLWFGGATIEHLAQVLNADEGTVTWPTLIQIKEGGDRPPLFCVHTQGGNLFHYYDLAGRLAADQPVYGLQARGVYGREDFHHRIEDIAAHCIDTMRAIMPDGPYLITGFSSGGLVAFEMAQQLLQAGIPPALLALVDTYPPYIRQRGHYRRRLQEFLRLNNLRYIQERLYHAVIHTLHMDRFRNFSHTGEAHRWAQWSYRTKPYPGPVTLFLAEDSRLQTKDPSLGWARVASSLKIYTIPGSHGVMMKPPNVMKLTTIIESLLDSLIIDHNIRTDW